MWDSLRSGSRGGGWTIFAGRLGGDAGPFSQDHWGKGQDHFRRTIGGGLPAVARRAKAGGRTIFAGPLGGGLPAVARRAKAGGRTIFAGPFGGEAGPFSQDHSGERQDHFRRTIGESEGGNPRFVCLSI